MNTPSRFNFPAGTRDRTAFAFGYERSGCDPLLIIGGMSLAVLVESLHLDATSGQKVVRGTQAADSG